MMQIWMVEQPGYGTVCAVGMRLTRRQAEGKAEFERSIGNHMVARPATSDELNPPQWIEEECDD